MSEQIATRERRQKSCTTLGSLHRIAVVSMMLILSLARPLWSAEPSPANAVVSTVPSQYRPLVPHRLLPLLHDAAVHAELKLTKQAVTELEAVLTEIDGPWFRLRILPLEKQWPLLDELESRFHKWSAGHWTLDQVKRLKQLECQAQGGRMLLRSDVARELKLSEAQQRKFAELAQTTEKAQISLQQASSKPEKQESTAALETALQTAAQSEQKAIAAELSSEQRKRLTSLIGPIFDTRSLERIYPLAPEFSVGEQWLNGAPTTLKSLRGKVVLVHFYAFQCHNCHANFAIYKRWHDELKSKGVVVIGIQSPETARERDPEAVRAAAVERKLEFPIIIDTEMKNWNAWANTMWPTVYVVDKQGYLRHWWQGELNWKGATGDKTIEKVVDAALAE